MRRWAVASLQNSLRGTLSTGRRRLPRPLRCYVVGSDRGGEPQTEENDGGYDASTGFLAGLGNELLEVSTVPQKGRLAVARCSVPAGTAVWECLPLAKVLKPPRDGRPDPVVCANCFQPLGPSAQLRESKSLTATDNRNDDDKSSSSSSSSNHNSSNDDDNDNGSAHNSNGQYCCDACRAAAWGQGEEILSRCDLGPLERLHQTTGRRFPLLAARLVGRMLCEFKDNRGASPTATNVANLCFARFAPQIKDELRADHQLIRDAVVGSGIVRGADFDQLFPPEWYFRVAGSLQLNAFELAVDLGGGGGELRASALLPGVASMFNHSCSPSLLVATDHSAVTRFVTACSVAQGEELCISYIGGGGGGDRADTGAGAAVSLDSPAVERRAFLLDKYGFTCTCPRCEAES